MINFSFKKMYTSKKFPPAAGIDPTGKNVWFEGAKKNQFYE